MRTESKCRLPRTPRADCETFLQKLSSVPPFLRSITRNFTFRTNRDTFPESSDKTI
jgi:hypothetical protein